MLADSGLIDLNVSNEDTLEFGVDFNQLLSPQMCKPIAGHFTLSGHQERLFTVKLDYHNCVTLQGGLLLGELSIRIREHNHILSLIKVHMGISVTFKLLFNNNVSTIIAC